jgi:hypothetical protein
VSPTYAADGQKVRRKNVYLPCVIGERLDQMTPAEQVAVLKATYWADLITAAEWPVVLRHESATAPNRSRLKRKAAGWLMALGRIAALNPDLLDEIARQARAMYPEQIGDAYPVARLALPLAGLRTVRNAEEPEP